jgi:hypothetical protein
MFDLNKPNVGAAGVAPYSIIYGQNGIGKSTFAAMPPGTLFADIERGLPEMLRSIPRFPVDTLGQLRQLLSQLREQQHPYHHIVIDSVSALNQKLVSEVCAEQKWLLPDGRNDMGEKGFGAFGRGDKVIAEKYAYINDDILKLKEQRNIAVTLLGHVRPLRVKPPDTDEYSRYDIMLPAQAIEVLTQRADIVGFMSYPVTVIKKEGQRSGPGQAIGEDDARLYLTSAATHNAKNRFGMPASIIIPRGNPLHGFQQYASFIPYFAPIFAQGGPINGQHNGAAAAAVQ